MSRQFLPPDSHPNFSLLSFADKTWNFLRAIAINTGSGPLSFVAQYAVLAFLRNVQHGQIRVVTSSRTFVFPETKHGDGNLLPDLSVTLKVKKDSFWLRVLAMSDLG